MQKKKEKKPSWLNQLNEIDGGQLKIRKTDENGISECNAHKILNGLYYD